MPEIINIIGNEVTTFGQTRRKRVPTTKDVTKDTPAVDTDNATNKAGKIGEKVSRKKQDGSVNKPSIKRKPAPKGKLDGPSNKQADDMQRRAGKEQKSGDDGITIKEIETDDKGYIGIREKQVKKAQDQVNRRMEIMDKYIKEGMDYETAYTKAYEETK